MTRHPLFGSIAARAYHSSRVIDQRRLGSERAIQSTQSTRYVQEKCVRAKNSRATCGREKNGRAKCGCTLWVSCVQWAFLSFIGRPAFIGIPAFIFEYPAVLVQ